MTQQFIAISEDQIDTSLKKEMYDRAWVRGHTTGFNKAIQVQYAIVQESKVLDDETKAVLLAELKKPKDTKKERLLKKKTKLVEQLKKLEEQCEDIENDLESGACDESVEELQNEEELQEAE